MKRKDKKNSKYINEFPIIIMVVAAILIILLANIYLSFRPYNTIHNSGYMVLSNNMTYNLVNNNPIGDNSNIGVVKINNGDNLYKQVDEYYVGDEKKEKVDVDYPIYSIDALTIYNINSDTTLINRNFEQSEGYLGLSLNYGILYNDDDVEPADDIDYLFLSLNNSIYINTQAIFIKTLNNEYTVPMNSPIYFNAKYINYYIFDGENFKYQRISDIYYDSIIKIGDVTLTYEEFMLKMGLLKSPLNKSSEEINKEIEEIIESREESKATTYVKPEVSVSNFTASVYSTTLNLVINDPENNITTYPTFEIYEDDKLYLRKKATNAGSFKIIGLSSNTKYHIVGKYKYVNENGLTIVKTFYDEEFETLSFDTLGSIELSSEIGPRHSNKLEIKNLKIESVEKEALQGIDKIALNVWKEGDKDNIIKYNLPYNLLSSLVALKETTVYSSKELSSNTVYYYEIEFFDKDNNELKTAGKTTGVVETSKAKPKISYSSNINNNNAVIDIKVNNKDLVYIDNFKYELYNGASLIKEGILNYDGNNQIIFNDLNYNSSYDLKISGKYDLEDGNGKQIIEVTKSFYTLTLTSFNANYDIVTITSSTISTKVHVSSPLLGINGTTIDIYLVDKDEKDILDDNGKQKHINTYTINSDTSWYYEFLGEFENLSDKTEYKIKVKISAPQIGIKKSLYETLKSSITTLAEDAYGIIKSKKLFGDNLDLTFDVIDKNSKVYNNQLAVEIYDGTYNSPSEIQSKYLYRKVFNLTDSSTITIYEENFDLDKYTMLVYYMEPPLVEDENEMGTKHYLIIENNTEVTYINRDIKTSLEMYDQKKNANRGLNTRINFKYNMGSLKTNLYVLDCSGTECIKIGYINSSDDFVTLNTNYTKDDFKILSNENGNIFSSIIVKNGENTGAHVFYVGVLKRNFEFIKLTKENLDAYIYTLSKLEYSTDYEINNIDDSKDFNDGDIIYKNNETRHYAVTGDLDFCSNEDYLLKLDQEGIKNFKGTIDFQGYHVSLCRNNYSKLTIFDSIDKDGILKNLVVNYNLNYEGVIKTLPGIVNENRGTIENILINVKQEYSTGRAYGLGLLAYTNKGTISNFVAYLNSNIYTYSSSSFLVYENQKILKNGYISSNPAHSDYKIYLSDDATTHGSFANINTSNGQIKYVYNLISVLADPKKGNNTTGGIATIVRSNDGSVMNTISYATLSKDKNVESGPNIYNNNYNSNKTVANNYYFDTNEDNLTYNNRINRKINTSSFKNTAVWEAIINQDKAYEVIKGYYPLIKMGDFMKNEQILVGIDYALNESSIDVISAEAIKDNKDGYGQIKVYVSNPNNYVIKDLAIDGLTVENISQEYNIDNQITTLTVDVSLEGKQLGKDIYNIVNLGYFLNDEKKLETNVGYSGNSRMVEISLYSKVDNYDDLVYFINKNSNIYLTRDITLPDGMDFNKSLPVIGNTYSSILDGNSKTIDFKEAVLSRGVFIDNLTGILKDLQIKNLNIESSNSNYVGFVAKSSYATISNVNLENVNVEINKSDNRTNAIYISTLVSYANNSKFSKISINNGSIKKSNDYQFGMYTFYIGGLAGYTKKTMIDNSYTYNFVMENLNIDVLIGYKTIGQLVGYGSSTTISSSYTDGIIDTGYPNVGGILGTSEGTTTINNCYSDVDIIATNNYVGGILGRNLTTTPIGKIVKFSMFLGTILNVNHKNDYGFISSSTFELEEKDKNGLYVYGTKSDKFGKNYYYESVSNIAAGSTLLEVFLDYDYFTQKPSEDGTVYLPYLKSFSDTEQKISDKVFGDTKGKVTYTATYNIDNDCIARISDIYNVYDSNILEVSNGRIIEALGEKYNNVNLEDLSLNDAEKMYVNACAVSANIEFNSDVDVNKIASENEDFEVTKNTGTKTFEITPGENGKYYNKYSAILIDSNDKEISTMNLYIRFYRKIDGTNWTTIAKNLPENIILMEDIKLEKNEEDISSPNDAIYSKTLNNVLGNNHTITTETQEEYVERTLINILYGTLRDVNFSKMILKSKTNLNYYGLIKFNDGIVENCNFENITLTNSANVTAIISYNSGYVKDITLNNIVVNGGGSRVSGLVAYEHIDDYAISHIERVKADSITITFNAGAYTGYLIGGIAADVTSKLSDITLTNIVIKSNGNTETMYVGGIVGRGNCVSDCSVIGKEDSIEDLDYGSIEVFGSYIGGIGGIYAQSMKFENLRVANLEILAPDNLNEKTSYNNNYIGGIYGYTASASNTIVNNLKIGSEDKWFPSNRIGGIIGAGAGTIDNSKISNSKIYGYNDIGGIAGFASSYRVTNSTVDDVIISGGKNVGGIMGNTSGNVAEFANNLVINSRIIANTSTVGGIVGLYNPSAGTPIINANTVINSSINGKDKLGGIVGYLNNNSAFSQNTLFIMNLAENVSVNEDVVENTSTEEQYNLEENATSGGIIGQLYQVPAVADKKILYSLFYGEVSSDRLIGKIENKSTGVSGGYEKMEENDNDDNISTTFSNKDNSNFKKYKLEDTFSEQDINSLNEYWDSFSDNITINKNIKDYMNGVTKEGATYYFPNLKSFPSKVEIPTTTSETVRSMSKRTNIKINKESVSYDIYASDVDKINIEFSSVDSSTYFYYKIGNYISEYIPIENRVYTVSYDFTNPIEINMVNTNGVSTLKYKSDDLAKTLSVLDGKIYYIQDYMLYSSSKIITGNFVNLYGNQALTSEGEIYNLNSKDISNANINYLICMDRPLYNFKYDNQTIKTYYKFSTVDDNIREYQLFVKNNNLSVISPALDNKKDSYVIDSYNDKSIELVLNSDKKVYNLKDNINYPSNFDNNDIIELYSNMLSSDTLVAVKYSNGKVYVFDYRAGKEVFSNVSEEYSGLLNYLKSKLFGSNINNSISSMSYDKYTEIELLKEKLDDISIDEAKNKINGNNSSINYNNKHAIVYNNLTNSYDVYSIQNLLSSDDIESETNKLYKDYQLAQFYSKSKGDKDNISLNGIIIFFAVILSIIGTIALLLRNKKKLRG